VGREDDIEAIVALGRRTRTPVPRGLWIAAAIVSVICITGFGFALLGDNAPQGARRQPPPPQGSGLEIGLAIGAGAGFAIGFATGRQRRSHSSRNSP
jgi:drug/metabolite transporter (DMT)-like permease